MNPNNSDLPGPLPEKVPALHVSGHIARCAQLAMLLEVSASPKPGNVDREHDYPDTCFEHFVASSVGVYPALEQAARSRNGIGSLVNVAVCESASWQRGGNTHFGAFLLLVPLAMAAGELLSGNEAGSESGSKFGKESIYNPGKGHKKLDPEDFEILAARAHALVRATDSGDAVEFYRAFGAGGVRVNGVEEFDLEDPDSTAKLLEKDVTLYDLMEISKGYDLIANEWTTGFRRCLEGAKSVLEFMQARNGESFDGKSVDGKSAGSTLNCSGTGINEAVVYTFLKLLSRHRDTFIQTKFDADTADYVSSRARSILSEWKNGGSDCLSDYGSNCCSGCGSDYVSDCCSDCGSGNLDFSVLLPAVQALDAELLEKRINPGSTADIVIAGLFIALLGGLRF